MPASWPAWSPRRRPTRTSPSCTGSTSSSHVATPPAKLLVQARNRGEIAEDTNLELTLDLLYGPIYHRLLHGHAPLTERFAQQVIDYVLTAIRESS